MTFEEYASKIGKRLLEAHNNKDETEAHRVFSSADFRLTANNTTPDQKAKFWSDVRVSFFSGDFPD